MPNIIRQFLSAPDKAIWLNQYLRRRRRSRQLRIEMARSSSLGGKLCLARRSDLTLLLDTTSYVDINLLWQWEWEREQCAVMAEALRLFGSDDPVFLDIGAYWGLYAMLAVKAGVRQVHAFEPDPRNHAQLHAQLFLNDLTDAIVVHRTALSDRDGEISFCRSEAIEGGNRGHAGVVADASPNAISVACARLDSLFTFTGRTVVMKIDVEGHELSVLRGMEQLVRSNRVFMQIESFEAQHDSVFAFAASIGLRHMRTITVDHYFTNISGAECRWLHGRADAGGPAISRL
ncbi:MAG: FkbM family methyltransferase [Ancalomicrobiaceae bacterium]|nr:FkbM family methyltransferase [Ancalomicrobiaceae bacterium]